MTRRKKTVKEKTGKQVEHKAGSNLLTYQNFLLFLLPVFIIATYYHTLHSPFVFDDIANVSENPAAQVEELSFDSLRKSAVSSPLSTRPVSYLTFAINYYFHGHEVYGYRLFNMVIHVLNGLFLYLFLVTTFKLPVLRDKIRQPFWVAYFTVLIWLIHPLQVQSVTYIVQRMNSLATFFYLLAFYLYLKARLGKCTNTKYLLGILSCSSVIMALGSKEIAVTLPFFILLYEWMFFQDMERRWIRRRRVLLLGCVSFLLGLLVGVTYIYVGKNPWQYIAAGYSGRDFTMYERLLTQPRVILHYIELFLFPFPGRLTLLPQFPISTSLVSPLSTIFALLATWSIIGVAAIMARKQRLLSFCIFWFMGNLVLESSVVPLEIIFLHRTYLPSMMVCLMVSYLLLQYLPGKVFAQSILIVCVAVLSIWTYQRNEAWRDKISFWQDCLRKNPTDFRVYNNLGKALEEKGQIHEAIEHFQKAIEKKPEHPRAYNNLGVALLTTGKKQQASDILHMALEQDKDNPETHYNLGLVHGALGDHGKAEEHYLTAHEIFPANDDPDVHNNLGIILSRQGNLDKAVDHFGEAIRINPGDPFAHNNLGITLARLGKYQDAITHFKHALQINPDDKLAWNNLQIVIAEMK